MRSSRVLLIVCVLGVALAAMASAANATILTAKDSADFEYKYEMDYLPTDVAHVDQDVNSYADFVSNGAAPTALGGILTITGGYAGSLSYYGTGTSSSTAIWPSNFTYPTGYTIEMKVKVNPGTTNGFFALEACAGNGSGTTSKDQAFFWINASGEQWNSNGKATSGSSILGTEDNTDDYHIFRIVQLPSLSSTTATFAVYRDGVLLSETLGPAYNSSMNGLLFGDSSTAGGTGAVKVDYVRLDNTGAYGPVPEPGTLSLVATGLLGLLAYAWQKRK